MMRQVTGIELSGLVLELKSIEGARVEKIYQRDDEFYFVVKKSGETKQIIVLALPFAVFFGSKPNMAEPSPFCSKLRSLVERAILLKVEQIGLERVVKFTFSTRDGTRIVYAEFFSKGNLVICDQDSKILLPYRSQTWKDRKLKRGEVYLPPPQRSSPLNTNKTDWTKNISSQKMKSLAGFLATECGMGGKAAELLCKKCNIVPSSDKVSQEQAERLFDYFPTLISELQKILTSKELLADWEKGQVLKKKENKKLNKINAIINQQQRAIEGLKQSSIENQEKAEAIYAMYQELTALFDKARRSKGLKGLEDPLIVKTDPKEKTIVVDLKI